MAGQPKRNAERTILKRPNIRERVLEGVLAGWTDQRVADSLPVEVPISRQSITEWRKRNAEELTALYAKAAALVEEVALRDKAERIRQLAHHADEMGAVLAAEGYLWEEPHGVDRTVKRVPTAVIKELRGLYRDIAEELGDVRGRTCTCNRRWSSSGSTSASKTCR